MASVAGRKKSIVSSAGLQIDNAATNNNTLLNKAASQSTSLYQQCSALRNRLMRIRGFSYYFNLAANADSRQSTDPVTQLWDLFSFGIPLCYIFDQLPAEQGFSKINNSEFNQDEYDANPDKPKKRAIALFAMQIRTNKVTQAIPGCEEFTVTDLWDRNSTDGLVKVINTVTAIVDHLLPDAFEDPSDSPSDDPYDSAPSESPADTSPSAQERERAHVIRELVETERKFVQDLEIMQKYATALSQGNIIDQDTIHLLFPGLNKLLNFQRKFLIRFESTAELPWQNQRWGQIFLESQDEFVVYEPYCSNYTNALELMVANEQNLSALNHLINVKGELPGLLIKPIQRVCKYHLFLDQLIKACSKTEYPHLDELKRGAESAKRITDTINEAQRRAENELTVKSLYNRIDDWKGHHLENFGELLLDDIFVVTKSDIDREYHVFLFEKIILCCKEALPQPPNGKAKVGKSNSILRKQVTPPPLALPGGTGQPARKNTPLLLKGRIFLGNVTQAIPVSPRMSSNSSIPTHYPLAVWWKGDDDLEYFTLRCRREDQMRQWEAQINRLIKESAQRRASERSGSGISRIANSTNPALQQRSVPRPTQSPYTAPQSVYSTTTTSSTASSATSSRGPRTPYSSDEHVANTNSVVYGHGPQGYPPADGFEFDPDEDDYEDYPPSSSYNTPSGRGTPIGNGYRRNNALSMPPERDAVPGHERMRAQTEDTNGPVMAQWRNNLPPVPQSQPQMPLQPNTNGMRPYNPRMHSTMSTQSYASDSNYGLVSGTGSVNGLPGGPRQRPPLRSQFSSTRLKSAYDQTGEAPQQQQQTQQPHPYSQQQHQPRNSNVQGVPMTNGHGHSHGQPVMSRSRSASQPIAYVPKTAAAPPPMPTSPHGQQWSRDRSNTTAVNEKRGSGSSQSTGGDSSDYSPNSSSPVTPFGSSESSLGGVGIRTSRSQYFEGNGNGMGMPLPQDHGPPVKVKVHFHEDIFVIQVARSTEYEDLVERVGRKIRLCGPRRDDGPLRVKYKDEDGDMVSLGSTEDVQMAFEQYRPGGQVTLFVT
ncbi:putative rho guanine nucleotide exchange factor scd1 [Lyophyllum shimeji]|uniref:Rho guanine nucleotide exchange factor scd1 n=1 Tax=Lyophyllum shimeji TaxID=47721 RepID=A0A9P3Q0X2_LYOSH|nr:putative rho guanine nucleotide exchange factor scd1 [Lyophyllum shimeji]